MQDRQVRERGKGVLVGVGEGGGRGREREEEGREGKGVISEAQTEQITWSKIIYSPYVFASGNINCRIHFVWNEKFHRKLMKKKI